MREPPVCAVIVTHHPTRSLEPLLMALRGQVARVVIVDNGSTPENVAILKSLAATYPDFIELILNGENIGLAAAQNQGIRAALAAAHDWVLLLDDDSVPAPHMVQTMLATAQQPDQQIGIVAPRMVEQNVATQTQYLVSTGRWKLVRRKVSPGETLDNVASVIASGSLIHRDVFARIGLMREGLFIDYIDHDFCLRARAQGFAIRVVGDAELQHRQGHKTARQFLGRRIITQNYSSIRRYYIFRNRMFFLRIHVRAAPIFLRHEALTCGWDIARILLLESEKWPKLCAAFKGIYHGIVRPIPPVVSV